MDQALPEGLPPRHAIRFSPLDRTAEAVAGSESTPEVPSDAPAIIQQLNRVKAQAYELITLRDEADADLQKARNDMYAAIERYEHARGMHRGIVMRIAAQEHIANQLDAALLITKIAMAMDTAPEIRS